MALGRVVCTFLFTLGSIGWAYGQDVPPAILDSPSATIPLTVPKGTPIQLILDKEVRVQKVGQTIHGKVAQPVYAFDRLVIPTGTEVIGQISEMEELSGKKRTLAILNADFTPAHKLQVEFNELVFADGRHVPLQAEVTPASGQVIQFVGAGENESKKKKGVKQAVSEKVDEAKQEAKRDWENAKKQVEEPDKVHRLERLVVAQLPVHPQYIDAGTLYFAELQEPLDFGSGPLTLEAVSFVGSPLPPGSLVHALLVTPLSSATSEKGAPVEAVISQPLFSCDHLILPQGSRLIGSVVQVQPARKLSRNGQLRIVFHDLVLPDGMQQRVDAVIEGLEAAKAEHVKLDTEGGARATAPKSRFLPIGLSLALASTSFSILGDTQLLNRSAGGATGFKLVGVALGLLVHSQPLGMAMGAYGASMSVYSHFLARGRDVVFPKDTAMEIGLETRPSSAPDTSK
jgi:hypothetical protein